jgi:2-hydroxychromene-2-carboxylate isomerase
MAGLEFHFDFGSPNAYLAHLVLPALEQRTAARFSYVPVLLGGVFKATGNRSPVEAFRDVKNKLEYQALETRRFIARHGIERYRRNPHFPVNTLTIMRGAIAARRLAVFERYVDALFAGMWFEARKLDDPATIQAVIEAAGLDAARILELTQDPGVKEELAASTARSVARGTFGAPTFYVGDEIFFGKDSLRDVEEAIVAARR